LQIAEKAFFTPARMSVSDHNGEFPLR